MPYKPYRFIPPKRRRVIRYAVPMVIAEVLRGGEAYRAFKFGSNFEVHTKAGSVLLEVGDFIVARFVKAAQQLFLPNPPRGRLLAAPGFHQDQGGSYVDEGAELWLRSNGTWSLFTQVPGITIASETSELYFSFVFWWPQKSKLYGVVCDNNAIAEPDIYEINPTTGIATALGQSSVLTLDGPNQDNFVNCGVIFGDYAYLAGNRVHPTGDEGVIYRFDGVTLEVVYQSADVNLPLQVAMAADEETMIAVFGEDGNILYSLDGDTWDLDSDEWPNILSGRAVYNPIAQLLRTGYQGNYISPSNAMTIQRTGAPPIAWNEDQFIHDDLTNPAAPYSMGFRHLNGVPQAEYVFIRVFVPGPSNDVIEIHYRPAASTGAYTQDTDAPVMGGQVDLMGKRFGCDGNKICLLAQKADTATPAVWSRVGDTGPWTLEKDWGINYEINGIKMTSGLYEIGLPVSPDRL